MVQLRGKKSPKYDVGFPSACSEYVLLSLFNKESPLAYGRVVYSKAGNQSRDRGGKKAELDTCHVVAKGKKRQKFTSTP